MSQYDTASATRILMMIANSGSGEAEAVEVVAAAVAAVAGHRDRQGLRAAVLLVPRAQALPAVAAVLGKLDVVLVFFLTYRE